MRGSGLCGGLGRFWVVLGELLRKLEEDVERDSLS